MTKPCVTPTITHLRHRIVLADPPVACPDGIIVRCRKSRVESDFDDTDETIYDGRVNQM